MALVAPSGIVAEVNAAWCRLTGADAGADVGRPLWQRFSPAERSRLATLVERYGHDAPSPPRPAVAGTQLRRVDGRRVDVALRLGTAADDRRPRILLVQLEPFAEDHQRTVHRTGTGDRQVALTSVARTVAAGGELRQIAETIVTAVARATGCPLVGLWRRGSARESLVLTHGVGFPPSAHGRLTLDTRPTGLAGHTLRSRSVVVIGGPSGTVADLPDALRDHGVASGAAVGLHGTAGADGLLTACAGHNQPLPPETVRFLAVVGDLLSMALQRESIDDLIAAERQRTTETARELERLRRHHALACDAAGVIDWRWSAPTAVRTDRRTSPPPHLSLTACLDGGPQALVDAAVDDDVDDVVDVIDTCLRLGDDLDHVVRLHTTDGVATVRLRGAVDRDADGDAREIHGYAAVVAPTIAATRGDDNGRLAQAAHDLNNLLAAILGTAEHLVEGATDRRRLTAIVHAGRRARELVAGLRPDHAAAHPLAGAYELADVVDQLRPLLPGLVGDDVRLDYELGRGARTATLSRDEVERILLNLISNSRDAMDAGGSILIAVDTCIQLESESGARSSPPVGSWARLTVRDDGAGMASTDRSRAFEPGFTTKRTAQHAGLGLASVRDAVAAAGGVIGVASAVGRGTTVEVYLPLAEQEPVRLQPLRPQLPTTGFAPPDTVLTRGVALLVDDEAAVRDLLCTLLERLEFTVVVAPDGERALEIADRDLEHLDLVVSDLRMPGIDGLTLGRTLRTMHPDTAIVLLTGAPPAEPISDHRLRVVRKPFDWETLRDAVRSLAAPTPALEPVYPAASG
ncbi:MAG: response regulator [Actinobacteria bacterium]|nr:response regulator [Actinomycetota bacterium]